MRVEGLSHNLFNVLLLLGLPISLIGLLGAAVAGPRRARSGRSCIVSVVTFLVTSLRLPGRDDVGHVPPRRRPGPRPAGLSRAARARRRDRPARARGWAGRGRSPGSGPLLGIFGSLLFSVALLPDVRRRARASTARDVRGAGRPDGRRSATRSTPAPARSSRNFPIWMAETQRTPALALPDEPPRDVLDLAHDPRFGDAARRPDRRRRARTGRPSSTRASPDADCFRELDLGAGPRRPTPTIRSTDVRVFEIVCP